MTLGLRHALSTRSCITRACTPASTGRTPIGTPILAAGNGVVIKAEFTSGYGRRVEIQHANGYVTTYSHMSGFARGIAPGVRVTQGQVIGYLGQSGLATGPHLHYEVIINGRFVDPMAIKLARTREFDGKMLAAFKRERDRIDQLMAQAPNAAAADARRRPEGQLSLTARPCVAGAPKPSAARTSRAATPLPRSASSGVDAALFDILAPVGVAHQPMMAIARRRADPSSACNSRWADVAANRSRPRTTSLTPCSASSTTTAR